MPTRLVLTFRMFHSYAIQTFIWTHTMFTCLKDWHGIKQCICIPVRGLMAYYVLNLQVTKMSYVGCGSLKSIKKAKETVDWPTMNTNFISTSANWYWCGTITAVEDSQAQRKIATHRIHERWFKVPKEICLSVFFYFPPRKKRRGRKIHQTEKWGQM